MRFIRYLRARFPLGALIPSSIAGVLATTTLAGFPITETAVGVLALLAFLLHMRVADEHKDLAFDRVHHPERPVPSGLISLRELRFASGSFSLLSVVLALIVSPLAALWLLIAYGYSFVAATDFNRWIRSRFFVYNTLNFLQLIIFQAYLYALISIPPPPAHYAMMVCFGAVLEVARKLSPKEGSTANDTYVERLGFLGAIVVLVSFAIGAVLASRTTLLLIPLSIFLFAVALSIKKHNGKLAEAASLFLVVTGELLYAYSYAL